MCSKFVASHFSVFILICSAVIVSACTPAIHSAANSLYKISTGASQNTSSDHLVIVTEPGNTAVDSAIGPTIEVEFVNQAGQIDTSINSPVTVAIGTNPAGGSLNGGTSAVATNGVATFSNLWIDAVGNGYTLIASASNVAPAPTTSFNIMPGTPSKLVFATEPASALSGASLGSITVKIEDANGNLDNSSVLPVSLAIGDNAGPGGTLSGSLIVNAVGGIATFPGLSIDVAGTGYTLTATSTGLVSATSSAFNISAAAAAKLVFTSQPSNAASGATLGAIVVKIEDALGNVVTGSSDSVILAIGNNAGPGGALSGTATVSAINGVASLSGLSIDKAGTGYTLTAADGALAGATSSAFNITAGTPSQLVFTTEPVNSTAATTLPSIVVTVEDSVGNTVTGYTNPISLAISTNPSGGTLSGTVPVNAVAGVATFSDLSIDFGGTGYKLTASATSGTPSSSVTSTAFNLGFPIPTSFTWSGSTTPGSGACSSVYTVKSTNGAAPARFTSTTTVNLTGAGTTGAFYSDPGCGTPITTLSFGTTTTSMNVYYKNSNVGSLTFTATAGSVTGSLNVTSQGIYVLSSGTSTGTPDSIFAMTISLQNSLGATLVAPSNIPFAVYGNYYATNCGTSDPTCASPNVGTITVPSGSSSVTYYYKDDRAESANPTANDQSGFFNGNPNNLWLTISPNNISSGSFMITGPTFVTPGTCAPYTITVIDQYQNVSPLASAQTIALASSASGTFYGSADSTCSSASVTSIPIAPGATSTTFYLKDNTGSDDPTLSATATGFTSVSFNAHAVNVIPAISLGNTDTTNCSIINGDLKCWGDNAQQGMVGNTPNGAVNIPTQVPGLSSGVTSMSGSEGIACATQNGGLYCWSGDGFADTGGATGEGFATPPSAPPGFGAGSGVTQIAIGPVTTYSTCMIINGGIYCAGDNALGELGNGQTQNANGTYIEVPDFPQGSGVTQLYSGQDSYCVIVNGGAECWGNDFGTSPAFVIPQGSGVTSIGIRKYAAYAVINGGLYNINGSGPYDSSTALSGLSTGVVKIASGYEYSCALVSGNVWCWNFAQNPAQIAGISNAIDVSASSGNGCALFADSEVKCWGSGYGGNLGNGTITDANTPVTTGSLY